MSELNKAVADKDEDPKSRTIVVLDDIQIVPPTKQQPQHAAKR